jgi:hypothetical protein
VGWEASTTFLAAGRAMLAKPGGGMVQMVVFIVMGDVEREA